MEFQELLNIAKERRTAKQYNTELNVSQEDLDKLYEFVKTAPSSMGLEIINALHFKRESEYKNDIVAELNEANMEKAMMASDIIILTTKTEEYYSEENDELITLARNFIKHVASVKGFEYTDEAAKPFIDTIINHDHANNGGNKEEWSARQAYILLAYIILGAKALGIESTPIEGFKPTMTSYLREKNMINDDERATLVVLLGYTKDINNATVGDKQYRKPVNTFVKYL